MRRTSPQHSALASELHDSFVTYVTNRVDRLALISFDVEWSAEPPQEPAEPISKENRPLFEYVRDRITAELSGDVKPEEQITQLDSLVLPTTVAQPQE